MLKSKITHTTALWFLIFALSACNLPTVATTQTADAADLVNTSAAKTVSALQTAGAFDVPSTPTPVPSQTNAGTPPTTTTSHDNPFGIHAL